jgi:catechol 2,3-dioxygenase-like lactoylglutathione lyase family enzyme
MRIDFRYSEFHYELWALGHMLEIIEPAIARLSEQDEAQTLAELEQRGWTDDPAEIDLGYQDIRDKRDYVLPRFMRGPFLVALWACFESGVQAVARGLHKELSASIELRELRGDSFLARSKRYYQAILGLELDDDQARYSRLVDLYRVRNALAHANGLREGMSEDDWSRLEGTLKRHDVALDMRRGMLVLPRAYLESAYSDVDASLRSVVERARLHSDLRRRKTRPPMAIHEDP